jgi:hypothetical protein
MKSRATTAVTLIAAPVIKSTLLFGATGAAVLKPPLLNFDRPLFFAVHASQCAEVCLHSIQPEESVYALVAGKVGVACLRRRPEYHQRCRDL